MRKAFLTSIAVLSLSAPTSALAMKTQLFDFREGRINANWEAQGDITLQKQKDGIVLQSGSSTGMLLTTLSAAFQPEVAILYAASPVPTRFYFAWVMMNDPTQGTMNVPFALMTGQFEEQSLSLRDDSAWGKGEKKIGIVLSPNSTIKLQTLELQRPNIVEKAIEAVRSFWKLDEARPYSINFVWGPLIGLNSAERGQLYDTLPPLYLSGTLLINAAAALVIVVIFILGSLHKTSRRILIIRSGIILFAAWMLLDLRMGSEFISWVAHDHETYINRTDNRTFRDREHFYDFAEFAQQYVENRSSYIFFAERPWPYLGNMRYLTYPSIPGIDYLNDDTWVVYQRPDMSVNDEGRLTVDGEAVTPAGTLLGRFDASSFIFRLSK